MDMKQQRNELKTDQSSIKVICNARNVVHKLESVCDVSK